MQLCPFTAALPQHARVCSWSRHLPAAAWQQDAPASATATARQRAGQAAAEALAALSLMAGIALGSPAAGQARTLVAVEDVDNPAMQAGAGFPLQPFCDEPDLVPTLAAAGAGLAAANDRRFSDAERFFRMVLTKVGLCSRKLAAAGGSAASVWGSLFSAAGAQQCLSVQQLGQCSALAGPAC